MGHKLGIRKCFSCPHMFKDHDRDGRCNYCDCDMNDPFGIGGEPPVPQADGSGD